MRQPLQGVRNILRFNWHFYAIAGVGVGLLLALSFLADTFLGAYLGLVALAVGWVVVVSLVVSAYVYDFSPLYRLRWLTELNLASQPVVANIHAGFDESSALLQQRLNPAKLWVFDFYNPNAHTEVAIKRARQKYPAYAGTQAVGTTYLPLPDNTAELVVLMLAAHEIRNEQERTAFFSEVRRITAPGGKVVVIEHLRDAANLLAYNLGAFHFYSQKAWYRVFGAASWQHVQERKITPFVSVFILTNNGAGA
ncbi:hypothetical protein ASU33_12950 [Solirubrum puertoriconensis]|uniref:Methyltransferase type 11 domain-containing protein n=1 Tax=Solirubrum puertoriconensis TaxID=1751427 RepID=A0A9X0HKZ1_SOLP1|nr:hypothetical protein ASU33_12950 [Solirubrum puertoriconensis]